MKAKYFVYVLLLIIFAFVTFERSWTEIDLYQTAPCIRFGNWQIGQSSGYGNTVGTSFITNSEQTCCVEVSVGYCENQPSQLNIMYPITKFVYELSMSHGFSEEKKVYSTSGPDASLFDPSTSFSVSAKFTGPPDTESLAHAQNGRNNEPMKVTVTFKGYYGSDTNNQKTVTLTKTWTQDSLDMLRQEYVDMTPPDRRAELPVPSRSEFVYTISSNGTDKWNTGHYGYMIDDGLKSKKSSWLAKVNEYRRANTSPEGEQLAEFTDTEFIVNSGYRNPYHQRFHVNAPKLASFHSRHCYGDALDIQTLDVDGDGKVEQVYDNKSKSDDGVLMEERAKDAKAKYTASWKDYTTKHTHADWTTRGYAKWPPKPGTVYSPPCSISGTASSGPYVLSTTNTTTTTTTTTTPSATLSPTDGSYTASSGDSHTASLSVPSGFNYVYWYLKSSSQSGLGTLVETDTGTGSTTSASYSWSVPSDASGDYVITAYTYLSDNTIVEPSYIVTVGSSTSSTPSAPSTPSTPDTDDSSTASPSPYSLSASSTGSPISAGDTVTLTLSGNESYYTVDWSVESPQYTSLSYDSADGYGSYESSTTYTFPNGYTGDYVFKAIVYTYGNMTRYEHTYTVTVGY